MPLAWLLCACGAAPEEVFEPQPGDPLFVRDPALDVENVSAHEQSRSHNMGLNCMRCHQAHGPGRGQFTVAGTLHNPDGSVHPNGTVFLRTAPGEAPLLTVEADRYGNYFSTAPLPFPDQSLFITVRSTAGLERSMPFPVATGACNHCHSGGFKVTVP